MKKITENARHHSIETQELDASAAPTNEHLKPRAAVSGPPIQENARHHEIETHERDASAAPTSGGLKPKHRMSGPPVEENARQRRLETHSRNASAAPTKDHVKPRTPVSGPPIPENARHHAIETQHSHASASPAKQMMKSKQAMPGSSSSQKGRQGRVEAHTLRATSTSPAVQTLKPTERVPGSSLSSIVDDIRAHDRARRFAMGIQQVLDRKFKSFVRINCTEWSPDASEAERAKANKEVVAIIKAAGKGEGDPLIVDLIQVTEQARAPADAEREKHEKAMETLAKQLPVAAWVESVPGLGLPGLATIVAETGDLANYANVAKVWKRLGYAPYNGLAGSSWKRETWREGRKALTKEEWIENPFSGKRYSFIHTIGVSLFYKQWIGAAKFDDGVGRPNGKYGEVYAKRQAHTAVTHPEWTKKHSQMDALRIMMKAVLKDLWLEWNQVTRNADGRHGNREAPRSFATAASPAKAALKPTMKMPGSPLQENGRQPTLETHRTSATASPAKALLRPKEVVPGSSNLENGRPEDSETQDGCATASPARLALKPTEAVPGSSISENGRQASIEAHDQLATASPAPFPLKPNQAVPGSPIPPNGRQHCGEAHIIVATASPAKALLKPTDAVPGSPISKNGRHTKPETHTKCATATPASLRMKPRAPLPGSTLS